MHTRTITFVLLGLTLGCVTGAAQTKPVSSYTNTNANTKQNEIQAFFREGLGCKIDEDYIVDKDGKCKCAPRNTVAGL